MVKIIGKIDAELFVLKYGKLSTDEVVITDERLKMNCFTKKVN